MTSPWPFAIPLLLLISLNFVMASGSLIDMFSTVCPYSNFCTVNSSKTLPSSSALAPCCLDCFCDENCALFGDCCPDIENKRTTKRELIMPLECKPHLVQNEYYVKEFTYLKDVNSYRIIDFCPTDNNSERCLWESDLVPDYDDMVVVSDRETGTPYKNKYCAQCHGVTDVIRWDLVIDYCRGIEDAQLLATEVNQFLYANCLITSIPGDDVPYNARTTYCDYSTTSCPIGQYDEDIVLGCNNGPTMPYRLEIPQFGISRVYKNALCYQCGRGDEVSFECRREYYDGKRSTASSSYSLLLNVFTPQENNIPNTKCPEGEILDTVTSKCRRIYCPPLEVRSQNGCVSIASTLDGVQLEIFYKPVGDVDGAIPSEGSYYNQSLISYYTDTMKRKVENSQCTVDKLNAYVFFYKDSKSLAYLMVTMRFQIDELCTMETIRSMVHDKPFYDAWILGENQLVKMKGKFTFYNVDLFDTRYISFILIENTLRFAHLIRRFFLCPYYVLNVDEYSQVVARLTKGSSNFNLTTFTPTTDTLQGYYQLSETEIAVCIETYTASLTSGSKQSNDFYVLHGLVLILVTFDILGLLCKAFDAISIDFVENLFQK